MTNSETKVRIQLIIEFAKTLHLLGTPAHRLENTVKEAGRALGISVSVFSVPTSIMLSFGSPEEMRTAIIRVDPGFINLALLNKVDDLLEDILQEDINPEELIEELKTIQTSPSGWGIWGTLCGYCFAGAAASRFFGGGISEIIVAMFAGLLVGFIMLIPMHKPDRAPLADLLAACIATFFAWTMTIFLPNLQPAIVVLASLVVLLPGLTTTLAINELATRNLASGSARLMLALMGFVALTIGSIIGETVASALPIADTGIALPLPQWTLFPALVLSGIALSILFSAKVKDVVWIIATDTLGFIVARESSEELGAVLGVSLGAFAVGIAGNLYRRIIDAPAATLIVPGIMILVPGGIGFQSVEQLFETTTYNIGLIVTVFTIAGGLVAGLLTANLIISPKKLI